MADDATPSLQARIRSLPFPAVLALGGATGLLAAVLATLSVEPAADVKTDAVAASTTPGSEPAAEEPAEAASANGGEGRGGSGKPGGEPEPAESARDAPTPNDPPSDDDATANPADEEADAGDPDDEEPVEVLDEADVGDGDPSPAPASSVASGAEPAAPTPTKSPDRSAEADATPDELFTMAKAAYDDGQYRDAYRLATKSQRAKASTRTQMLRGRAACRLKDEKNAKAIVRSFKLGDERRKELRGFCKDRGVRVGL